MRRTSLPVLALAAALLACTSPCEELGNKLCDCAPVGVSRDACRQDVQDTLGREDPSDAEQDRCDDRLDRCNPPPGVSLCEFLASQAGKEACGISFPAAAP